MSAKVQWSGLTEFLREFGSIPQALHAEGFAIIRDETEGARTEIELGYPKRTGKTARRIKTDYPSSTILVGRVIVSTPLANIIEFSKEQPRRTDSGANRGVMKRHYVTVPIARRRRARMARRMVDLLRSKGFRVGDA